MLLVYYSNHQGHRGLHREGRCAAHASLARLRARRLAIEALRGRHFLCARDACREGGGFLVGEAGQGRVGLVERLRQQGRPAGLYDRDVRPLHRLRREDRRGIRHLRRGLERQAKHLGV